MRALFLTLAPVLAFATAAAAQTPAPPADAAGDAASATRACISAIVSGAPVGDIAIGEVAIRRGRDPVSCTVTVTGGQPVVVRDAVMKAIAARPEQLLPARSRWDPDTFATRETFCSLPSRHNLMTTVSTGKPGAGVVLVATVVELDKRDPRCDQDLGVQKIATADQAALAEAAKVLGARPGATAVEPAPQKVAEAAAPPKPRKKKLRLPRWPF